MWLYWVLFWLPAVAALGVIELRMGGSKINPAMLALAVLLALAIGLRFEVGMDWGNYLEQFNYANDYSFAETLFKGDPAYGLLNWLAVNVGFGVWMPNLVCAIMFASGLVVFCRKLPNPWLALTIAMPYMAIVMAMNYTRQGAAFGLVLWGLVALQDGQIRRFLVFIVLAALFHKTAILLIPLALFGSTVSYFQTFLWVSTSTILGYVVFIAEHEIGFYENYILEQYASDGAAVRVAMNSVAAVVFLLARSLTKMEPLDRVLWTRFSLVTLVFLPLLELSPSSTAVDRMALYFMPIQLVAFSYLPNIAARWGLERIAVLGVVAGYWAVMFVWFNYANFSFAWLPYRFYPIEMM